MDTTLRDMLNGRKHWGLSAAEDLTNALTRVTGSPVPLYRESEAPTDAHIVYVGPVRAARTAGLAAGDLMAGGWRIVCDGRRAFILGRTGMGTMYGVTEFLDRFAGYRFMAIEGDDPYVVNPAVAVPQADISGMHAIYERHFSARPEPLPWLSGARALMPDYMRRIGLHVTPESESWVRPSTTCGRHCHTYFSYLSPKDHFRDHPEYFSMSPEGRREPVMLCLSNPEVLRIVTARLLDCIARDRKDGATPPPSLYDFSQEDNSPYICRCPTCQKLIDRYGGDSGLQLWFVNRLARTVRERYPDVFIRTFAYVSTETLPVGIVPERNVMFWLCDLYSKCDHQLPLSHPLNSRYYQLFRDWSRFAPKLEIWDYMLYTDDFPEVSVDAIAADTRYFRDLGVTRIYHESQFCGQAFWELDTYVKAKLFRNPDADLEKAVDEYCAIYGRGAAEMRQAIDELRREIAAKPPANVDLWHFRALPWRTREVMTRFRDHVLAARAKESAPRSRARTALALRSASKELMRLANAVGDGKGVADARADFLAASEELCNGRMLGENDRAKALAYSADQADLLTLRFTRLPKGLGKVSPGEIHCLDVRCCLWASPKTCTRVADPDSESPVVIRATPDSRDTVLDWALVREGMKVVSKLDVKPVAGPDYRWYRLGVARVCRGGNCFLPVHLSFALGSRYIECDGLKVDPNWYEFWLSVKYTGDAFDPDPKKGLFIDRLLLRRVSPPVTGK